MRNAPWNADDLTVLREKWRLINETASQCELFLQTVEILRIRVAHVEEGTSEHENLAVEARGLFIATGQQLLESGLAKSDWDWFVANKLPDKPEQWKELAGHWQQANQLRDLFHRLAEFVRSVATAKRGFSDAVRLTLNAWEAEDRPGTSWYQKVDEGIRIHGKLVEVGHMDLAVLHLLCQRTNRPTTYKDLAALSTSWRDGLDAKPDKTTKSTKSNIRSCLGRIRKAIRQAFTLQKDQDPVKKNQSGSGWKLDKDLLQEKSQ